MRTIRILADDLTGALDTAAAFSGEIPVFIDQPPAPDSAYWASPVAVVATPTRDVVPGELPAYLQPLVDWFGSADLSYKKVDSLLRGNTFAEIAWLLGQQVFAGAVFAPAFPAQGRFTYDDRQWVAKPGQPAQAVASPLRAAFAALQTTVIPTVNELGKSAVWIPEVRDDGGLEQVAALINDPAQQHRLWCGSAGLAHAIARCLQWAPAAGAVPSPVARCGPTVLISASFQPVLYAQWEALQAAMPTPAIAERARVDEIARACRLASDGERHARFDLSPRREMTQDESMALLQQNVQRIVDGLPPPGQLLIVGGDTLLAICRATGAQALLAGASIRAGWGCASLVGGAWDGTRCYSRSGAFGDPDDLVKMMRLLTGDANLQKGN